MKAPLRTLESSSANVTTCVWWEGRHLFPALMKDECGVEGEGEI